MRVGVILLRAFLVAVLGLGLLVAPVMGGTAAAQGVEMLMVPSPAMGRDIPVAFQAGGPQAVYLLDAFDAAPDVSNWVTAGNAMNTLAGSGLSVVAPAGGAYSLYTNWEQDGSKQWETFLTVELPNWLAANKGIAPNRHAVVGAAQGGTAALTLAAFHPDRFSYAGSLSGFLTPSRTDLNGAITAGMGRFGGVDTNNMWGPPQFGRWKWHDPDVHVALLVQNNTRLWVYSSATMAASDPAAMIGYPDQAFGSSKFFYNDYRRVGGKNAHFDFPDSGDNGWGSWSQQLGAMAGDIQAAIG